MIPDSLDHGEQLRHYAADPHADIHRPIKPALPKVREPLPAYGDDDTAAFVDRLARYAKWLQRACYVFAMLAVTAFCACVMLWPRK